MKTHHWVSQQGPASSPVGTWTSDNASARLPGPPTVWLQSCRSCARSDCKHGAVTPLPKQAHSHICELSSTRRKSPGLRCFLLIRKYDSLQVQLKCRLLVKAWPHSFTDMQVHTHTHKPPPFKRGSKCLFFFFKCVIKVQLIYNAC